MVALYISATRKMLFYIFFYINNFQNSCKTRNHYHSLCSFTKNEAPNLQIRHIPGLKKCINPLLPASSLLSQHDADGRYFPTPALGPSWRSGGVEWFKTWLKVSLCCREKWCHMTQEERDDSSKIDENIAFGQLGWVSCRRRGFKFEPGEGLMKQNSAETCYLPCSCHSTWCICWILSKKEGCCLSFDYHTIPYRLGHVTLWWKKEKEKNMYLYFPNLFLYLFCYFIYITSYLFSYLISQIQTVQHDLRWSLIHRWTHTHNTLPAANDTWRTFSSTGLPQKKNHHFMKLKKNKTWSSPHLHMRAKGTSWTFWWWPKRCQKLIITWKSLPSYLCKKNLLHLTV